jgi:GNAT superfamily N-acetyltransferase
MKFLCFDKVLNPIMTRKAQLADVQQLSELFDQYRIFYHKDSDIPAAEKFLTERIENNDSEIFLRENEGKLVGFVQLYPLFSSTRMKRYWLLNDLYVNENYRGKGFSKQLIEASKELAKSTDAAGILLETGKSNRYRKQALPKLRIRNLR